MSNLFTLDSLREEADKDFRPFVVTLSDGTEAVLKNILRLNKKAREAILEAINGLSSDDTTVEELAGHVTSIISGVSTNTSKLLKDLDGDLAVSMKLIEKWMAGTQLPEAESSPVLSTDSASI